MTSIVTLDMHKEIVQRLREFMFRKGMNQDDLAERLRMSRSTFSQQLNKTQRLALDMVVGPLAAFPKLSPDWLMFGKGGMERDEQGQPAAAVSLQSSGIVTGGMTGLISQAPADGETEALRAKVREQERQISMLMEMLHEATVGRGRQ